MQLTLNRAPQVLHRLRGFLRSRGGAMSLDFLADWERVALRRALQGMIADRTGRARAITPDLYAPRAPRPAPDGECPLCGAVGELTDGVCADALACSNRMVARYGVD